MLLYSHTDVRDEEIYLQKLQVLAVFCPRAEGLVREGLRQLHHSRAGVAGGVLVGVPGGGGVVLVVVLGMVIAVWKVMSV